MADTKLSALTEVTTLTDTDEFYVNDGGTPKRITKANLDDNIDIAASQVSVTDSGGNFTATDVEAGLLEALKTGLTFKNKIIDGVFSSNQDGVSGSVVLSAGEYGHDMWRGGSGGCTYTFSTTAGVTTLTISAGTLEQEIEGDTLRTGTHVLSWSGTAQGQIDSGGYGTSGNVTASLTAGTNTTIEFNTGTLTLVQLEEGSTVTGFEYLPKEITETRVYRYYEAGTVESGVLGGAITGNQITPFCEFKTRKRTSAVTVRLYNSALTEGQLDWQATAGTSTSRASSTTGKTVNGFSVLATTSDVRATGTYQADCRY